MAYLITPAAVFIALAAAGGAVHGLLSDRWHTSAALGAAEAKLDRIPTDFGDWRGKDLPLDRGELTRAGVRKAIYRRYRNERTGAEFNVLLECGPGGPISVHTPDVCYAGAGFRPVGRAERVDLPVGRGGLWAAAFGKPESVPPRELQVRWAWSLDGNIWAAPESPRAEFARFPGVFKLYVVRETPARPDDRVVREFLELFLKSVAEA